VRLRQGPTRAASEAVRPAREEAVGNGGNGPQGPSVHALAAWAAPAFHGRARDMQTMAQSVEVSIFILVGNY